jgi:uncharacterized protein
MEHPRAEVLVASTWDCNLRCAYCFVDRQGLTSALPPMSPALAMRLVDALHHGLEHVDSICIHPYGGEPLTNLPALEALVSRARHYPPGRFTFAITTNGTCLSDEALELLEAGRFAVVLSVDGPAHIHDQCRRSAAGEPTHALVVRALETLRSRTHCTVRGSSVVRRGWRLRDAEAYLRSLPIDCIKAQPIRAAEGSPFALTETDYAAYHQDLRQLGQQVMADIEADRAPHDDRFNARVLRLLTGEPCASFCGAGVTGFGIGPTGDVLPCVLLPPEGNLLGHIDADPSDWVEAGRQWAVSRPLRDECRECADLDLCGGGCPALMPVCGEDECRLSGWACEVARSIHQRFRDDPTKLLVLGGA